GFNIYATDLELVLLESPAVHEVAVVALPSRAWGETPLAIVVLEQGAHVSECSLKEWANERLGKAQRIARVVRAGALLDGVAQCGGGFSELHGVPPRPGRWRSTALPHE
ncbi:hypothetical protein HN937_05665, partial [Candidatus Poribacteria bacterium]|nr:hypothetical protein [Candidatus Poribacteria bacterium]